MTNEIYLTIHLSRQIETIISNLNCHRTRQIVHLLLILRIIHHNKSTRTCKNYYESVCLCEIEVIYYWRTHYVDYCDSYLTVPARLVCSCATLVSTWACAVVYFWLLFNSSIIRYSSINSIFCENWWTSTCIIKYLCWLTISDEPRQ